MGFQNIGPNYWKGEEGRQALLKGTGKYTDAAYVETFKQLAAWQPYMPEGFEAVKYPDTQSLFTLGKAAVYPTGSWEIGVFEPQATFEMGIFPPPVVNAGDTCYISDHTDIALGMNAATTYPEEARTFLEWMTSQEFAELYSNALPWLLQPVERFNHPEGPVGSGVYELARRLRRDHPQLVPDPLARRANLENELWRVSAAVINGSMTPEQAGQEIQAGLDSWYKPGQ